ncbi:MAG TPA: DUF1476 domain-containing protein [Rhodospirillaceae bacterium]|nr:DUF1476 domain-containing protein [Rhodospirillaceae bacterium]
MTAMEEREKAFEAKYHLDEEMAFKANVRRAKLLGLWAAAKLGLADEAALAYARSVVEADLADGHHGALISKLLGDLAVEGIPIDAETITHQMDRLAREAQAQVVAELVSGKQTLTA